MVHAEGAESAEKGNHGWTQNPLRSLRALREIDKLFQGMADERPWHPGAEEREPQMNTDGHGWGLGKLEI